MDVTLPNGKVIKGVPSGTPKDVIMQKAISSGLAVESDFGLPAKTEDSGFIDSAIGAAKTVAGGVEGALSIGSGMVADAAGGLAGIGAALNPFNEQGAGAERAKYVQELLTYQPKTDEGKALMERVSSLLSPVAESIQGFEKNLGDYAMDKTGSPLAASVATALPALAGELIGAGAGSRMAKSAAKETAISQAKNAATKAIDAKEASTGIKQLTTDALPPDTRAGKFMQQQGEVIAGGERAGQQTQRVKAVENLLGEYNVDDLARYESKIVEGVKQAVGEKKAVFAGQYQDLTDNLNNFGTFDIPATRDFASKMIAKEESKGSLADKAKLSEMQDFLDAPEGMDFETVKSVRSAVGRKLEDAKRGAPLQGSSDVGMLSQLYKQLTSDMRAFASTVNPELAAKWSKADSEFSKFATGNDKAGAKALIKRGDATPEIIDQLLFSKKPSDIEFLKKNSTKEGVSAAKQRVLQMALNKSSFDGVEMNPNKFQTQLDKLKPQINIIFDAKEKAALADLNQVLRETRRAQDAAVATATGQSLVPFMLFTNPAALSLGVVQAVVEKPMLRNILVKRKAAKTAKDRAVFDKQLQEELVNLGLIGAATGGSLTATQGAEDGNNNK